MSKTIIQETGGPRMRTEGQKALPTRPGEQTTVLGSELDETQAARFLQHVTQEWKHYFGGLTQWRNKMTKYEKYSKGNYEDRIGAPDPNNSESVRDVFSYQNETLGTTEGFADFANAQAKDDIFGTRPWLAAAPEGKADNQLAEQVTKHAHWKLSESDIECSAKDAIRIACWGGTAFLKSRWDRKTETFKQRQNIAITLSTGEPIIPPSGQLITTAEELEQIGIDGADIGWREQLIEQTVSVYDNSRTDCLDFNDVAFDAKAKELHLDYTPFYSRLRMPLLDVIQRYKIPKELHHSLLNAFVGHAEEARTQEGESSDITQVDIEVNNNPMISLVEGFCRFDHFRDGNPVRTHCIFSPNLDVLFSVEYLALETPDGTLPVFPVRIDKQPRRIFGRGYFEKFEKQNDSIDRQHSSVVHRNQLAANVLTSINPDALEDPADADKPINARLPVKLKADRRMADYFETAAIPDMNERSIEIMNQQLQMIQMRSGITSAAQGELKGVPNASTATGVNQLTSRGALLLKDPISTLTEDIRKLVWYNVNLIYANQDRDETFRWGEGETAELLTIKAGDVKGLRMNVHLALVQSQNQQKLANSQAGIGIGTAYASLPEIEKTAQRQLYVQALTALGFNDADKIIRAAVTDPAGILALLPPDTAPIVEQALVSAGVMAAPSEAGADDSSAPVTGQP